MLGHNCLFVCVFFFFVNSSLILIVTVFHQFLIINHVHTLNGITPFPFSSAALALASGLSLRSNAVVLAKLNTCYLREPIFSPRSLYRHKPGTL